MTVSNLIAPIMVYLDRFLISAFLSVAAVAYYATPFELVTKLWLVPVALTTVLFPAFAAFSVLDKVKLKLNYARGVRSCFVLLFPAVFLIFLFAPEGLHLWLGPRFVQQSTVVVRWFALGVLINSLAFVPFALLQAANRPDLTGKLHLIEVPFYIVASVTAIRYNGLHGAAFVWAMRLMVEAVILFILVRRVLFANALPLRFIAVVLLAVAALLAVSMETRLSVKLISTVIVLGLYLIGSWWAALEDPERNHLRAWFGAMVQARD
jgi:O-antigen/teichoic acid export membrane protein